MHNRSLQGLKVAVVGGSIAGCAAYILLTKLGAEVTVFERSANPLQSRGAGIMLPPAILEKCIVNDLFAASIAQYNVTSRGFYNQTHACLWHTPFNSMAFAWADIFNNLRSRIPNHAYHSGATVTALTVQGATYKLTTATHSFENFDLIIAADGINSAIREKYNGDNVLNYAGYIVWRGILPAKEIKEPALYAQHCPYFVYENGHFLSYWIPDSQSKTEKLQLNWMVYEKIAAATLPQLLVDKNAQTHAISLPQGSLSKWHIEHLQTLAKNNFPQSISDVICATAEPFIQVIYDKPYVQRVSKQICYIGDAACTLRPHTASGAKKALEDVFALADALKQYQVLGLDACLDIWYEKQKATALEQIQLSKRVGDGLINNPPNWSQMNASKMQGWWQAMLSGMKWYATDNANSIWSIANKLQQASQASIQEKANPRSANP